MLLFQVATQRPKLLPILFVSQLKHRIPRVAASEEERGWSTHTYF